MGRINPNDYDKYDSQNNSNSEWLKLQNHGDVARVQFLYDSYNDLETFACHKVKVGVSESGRDIERLVDCKRSYDDPIDMCPFCAAGIPVKPVTMVSMFDHKDQKVKIWERGTTFRKQLESFFNRYPKLSDMVFEIERNGQRGDKKTTYQLFPMPDVEPIDVSNVERPEFLGTVIMDKTPEEMQTYIDTGSFPEREKEESSTSESTERPTSRRGVQQSTRAGVTRRPRVQ
jgi:hypothetical protein